MSNKIKGIVISSIDYKDKDKLITIFSLEKGLITAKLTGVKNPKAKMKPFKEVFCFADFDLITRGNFSVITSAEVIESFYSIVEDIDKYFAGCSILEILKIVVKEEKNEILFVETLKTLKTLAFDSVEPQVVVVKFLIKLFETMGYQLSLENCSKCSQRLIGKRYFDFSIGEITCAACKSMNAENIQPIIHSTLRIISITDYDKLKSLKIKKEGVIAALSLLTENFAQRFDRVLSIANKF